jgi:hypothetical protein
MRKSSVGNVINQPTQITIMTTANFALPNLWRAIRKIPFKKDILHLMVITGSVAHAMKISKTFLSGK